MALFYKKKGKYNLGLASILFRMKIAKDIQHECTLFKGEANGEHYLAYIPKIVAMRKDAFDIICSMPNINSYEEFCKADFIRQVELERELYWQAAILSMFTEKINKFLYDINNYYKVLLLQDSRVAINILESIEKNHGLSIWLIENKILALGILDGPDGIKKYTNSIIESDTEPFFKAIVEKLGDRALPGLSWKRYDNLIDTYTQELKDANKSSMADYIIFKLDFYKSNIGESVKSVFGYESLFPITDRYLSFLKCLQILKANGISKTLNNHMLKVVEYLEKNIQDPLLHNISIEKLKITSPTQFNAKLQAAYEFYTKGTYNQCREMCEEILLENPTISEVYEIYVKSVFRLNMKEIIFSKGTVLNKILSLMLDILPKNEKSKSSYNELIRLVYIFASHHYIANVFYFCCNELRYCSHEDYERINKFATLNSIYLTPSNIAYQVANNSIKYTPEADNITYYFLKSIYLKEIEALSKFDLPIYRKQKYLAKCYQETKYAGKALLIYNELEKSSDILTVMEAVISKAEILLESGAVTECLDHIVNAHFKAPLISYKMPISKVLNVAECNVNTDVYNEITLLIVYDLYIKNISPDKLSKMYEAYDEFMFRNNIDKPLEVLCKTNIPLVYITYFLRHVCIPNVMDISGVFKNSNDVLYERVKICLKLQELDPESYNSYTNEIEEILTSLALEKASSKIGSGRIFIDTAGIGKFIKSELIESFQIYLELPEDPEAEGKLIQYDETGEKFLPGSKKDQLLIAMFEEITKEFVLNRDYGLDGNLSLEIRHGQLESLFWVPLEKLYLVTKKDDKGHYQRNSHWGKIYEIVMPCFIDLIDAALKEFSKDIDDEIDYMKKEWFVARTSSGPFNFAIQEEDLQGIKSRTEGIANYDDFYSTLCEIIMDITETNLKELRKTITDEIPALFDHVFQKLNQNLLEVKRQFVLAELDTSIALGRNELHKSIDELVGWLDFRNKLDSPDFSISLPLNLSVGAFSSTYSHKKIEFEINCCDTPLMAGRYLHDFVRIFLTLFDNIVRHSWLDTISKVQLEISYLNNICGISIKNMFNQAKDIHKVREDIGKILVKINNKSYSDSVNKEGNTGLYKIDKILSVNMGCEHKIEAEATDDFHFIFKTILDCTGLMV